MIWNLFPIRNLNDLETAELVSLSYLLSSVTIHNYNDSWSWPLDSSNNFTVKSLVTALMNNLDCPTSSLHKVIWSNSYTKKIKICLWELSLVLLTQRIDFRDVCLLYCSLSPSWYIMCSAHSEDQSHIFLPCSFASRY